MGSKRAPSESQKYSLYNLSVLLPLPKQRQEEAWGLQADACGTELLPFDLFKKIPELVIVPFSAERRYYETRLVGVRFDPKAEETRLVFQPILWAEWGRGEKGYWAEDAAIHLFYKTPQAKIREWQNKMQSKFGARNKSLLGVHPYFKPGGRDAELGFVLCDLANRGAFKATFMTVRGRRVLWSFGGFHIDRDQVSGQLVRGTDVAIPNAEGIFVDPDDGNMSVQRVARLAGFMRAGVLPKPNRGDNLMELFLMSEENALPDPQVLRQVNDRIENPVLNSPQTVDCVSCHASESTRIWLETKHKLGASSFAYLLDQEHSLDLSISEPARRNSANFRSFGYLDAEAVISRRVLNETVQMQRFLQQSLALQQPRSCCT